MNVTEMFPFLSLCSKSLYMRLTRKVSRRINKALPSATSDPVFLVFRSRISESDFRRHVAKASSGSLRCLGRSRQSLADLVYSVDLLPARSHFVIDHTLLSQLIIAEEKY